MKKLLYILLFFPLQLWATDYYVSNAGDDGNAGTSSGQPWETLEKVRTYGWSPGFAAGDRILFHRGDTFRGYLVVYNSGSSGSPITFGAYGAGVKPKIIGAIDASSTSNWTNTATNIWRMTGLASPVSDAGNVIYNNEASCGVKRVEYSQLTSQGNWHYDSDNDYVYIYSTANPGTYYSHIEIGGVLSENIITAYGRSYVTFDNLDVRYSANNGIFLHNCSNINITHCEFSWIGGMYYGLDPAGYRMGNGIQIWNNANDFQIYGNYVHDTYDTGISPQGEGAYTQANLNIHHNLFNRCYWTYEVFMSGSRTLTNVDFNNNTCLNSGSGWSVNQRPDAYNARHVRTWGEDGTLTGNDIKNNIFAYATITAIAHYYECPFIMDYNLYYVNTVGYIYSSTYTTLAQWQSATSQESHSLSANPLFNSDFTLQESSPAVGAGTNLGYSTDYNGDPIVGTPDMGAFEYQGEEYVEQLINLVIEGHSFVAPGSYGATIIPSVVDYSSLHNVGMGGSEIEDVESRAATVDGYLVSESSTLQNVLCLWIGVNDLSYIVGEGATHYALLKSYVEDRVAAGWDVFAFTITPSDAYGRGAQFEIERNVFNNLMRNDLDAIAGVHVLNTDAVPQLVDIDNTYYWPAEPGGGALHPSAAAVTLAAGLFSAAVESFWGGEEPVPVGDTGIVVSGGKFVVISGKLVKKQ